jgi:transcriptional regulator with XRE-family HTH domain
MRSGSCGNGFGWSGVDFAKHMGVTPETVSRWESAEHLKPMGGTAERLLRLAVAYGQPIDEYPIDMLTEISDDQVPKVQILALKPGRTGWAPTTIAARGLVGAAGRSSAGAHRGDQDRDRGDQDLDAGTKTTINGLDSTATTGTTSQAAASAPGSAFSARPARSETTSLYRWRS